MPGRFAAMAADLRHATRQLVRRPGHTLSVIACLVVGLVISIGTFSVIESLFVGDQPGIHDRRSIARIFVSYDSAGRTETGGNLRVAAEALSLSDFAVMRSLSEPSTLEAIGAEGGLRVTAGGDHGPVSTNGAFASGGFFRALRTEAGAAGRLLVGADDSPGATPVVVISDYFWRTQLDARPDVVGRTLFVSGLPFTIVGVAPRHFHGMQIVDIGDPESTGTQLWLPLVHAVSWPTRPVVDEPWLMVVGRTRRPDQLPAVELELNRAAARVAAASPALRGHATAVARPHAFGPTEAPLEIVGVILLVMLLPLTVLGIGCANVANLQLARAAERSRELAVRLSLGATRRQVIRLLTLETLACAVAAVALALGVIVPLMRYFQPLFPMDLTVDWRVAVFATALAVAVALGTGLMPAWLVLRKTAAVQLKQTAQSGGLGHSRLRAALIVAQVAVSLGLLTMTALVVRTIRGMELSAPEPLRHQMVGTFNPHELGMTPVAARTFADTVAARLAADGRVTGVALSTSELIRFAPPEVSADGRKVMLRPTALVGMTPSWLDVMGVRVLAGRRLTANDDGSVALLSARAAEIASPAGSALGMVLHLEQGPPRSRQVLVVGIVADNPLRPSAQRPNAAIYTVLPPLTGEFTLRVRAESPEAIADDFLKVVTAVDPRVPWISLRRGDMRFQDEARDMGVLAVAVGVCGVIALVLSATGLYAVMSYIGTLRRREIGVRLAIGAEPGSIIRLMMRQALTLVTVGAAAGLAISIPLAFLMRASFVARVNATDPVAFGPALALLFVVGAVAAAVPAFRAASVDPVSTLRNE